MATSTKKKSGPLDERARRFAEGYVLTANAAQSYLKAGYKCKESAAPACASRLLKTAKVASYIEELRRPAKKSARLTLEEIHAKLAEIVNTPVGEVGPENPICQEYTVETVGGGNHGQLKRGKAPSGNETVTPSVTRARVKKSDILRAMDMAAKLQGFYAPEQVVVETGPITLNAIEDIAARARIVSPLLVEKIAKAAKSKKKKA